MAVSRFVEIIGSLLVIRRLLIGLTKCVIYNLLAISVFVPVEVFFIECCCFKFLLSFFLFFKLTYGLNALVKFLSLGL